jgi:hypothetical protein
MDYVGKEQTRYVPQLFLTYPWTAWGYPRPIGK